LRGHLDAADYKSVVLGLIFLKYESDMFEQVLVQVEKETLDDPEDRDVYLGERVFDILSLTGGILCFESLFRQLST